MGTKRMVVYVPEEMWHEITGEAERLEQSASWIVRMAWGFARDSVRMIPDRKRIAKQITSVQPVDPKLVGDVIDAFAEAEKAGGKVVLSGGTGGNES